VIVIVVIIIILSYLSLRTSTEEIQNLRGRSVFISGCDTGFGRQLALDLDKKGLKVFAGCLTENGVKELKEICSSIAVPIICDITKSDDIKKTTEIISAACPEGLWALVNNAGIGIAAEWDWASMAMIRKTMEVNFFGHVAVTKSLLGLLKKRQGRIINIASMAGYVAAPHIGPYSCTKYAMEAFTDSLRREMKPWHVGVFVLEPYFMSTPMVVDANKGIHREWEGVSDEVKAEYGKEYAEGILNSTKRIPFMEPPENVVKALVLCVTGINPPLRKRIGKAGNVIAIVAMLPTKWADYLTGRSARMVCAAAALRLKKLPQ